MKFESVKNKSNNFKCLYERGAVYYFSITTYILTAAQSKNTFPSLSSSVQINCKKKEMFK